MTSILAQVYRAIPRPLVRGLLWAVNAKFNVGAVGLFTTHDKRVLVLKHVYRHSSPWGLPGGYLQRGETAEDGVLRELREETALTATISGVLCVDDVDSFQREIVFTGTIDPNQTAQLNFEIAEHAFVAPDDLPLGMLPRHAQLVERWRRS